MEKDLVSIITPCYNGESYLEKYFNSLLNQTYKKIEIIFINDGSSDNTEVIAKKFGQKLNNKGYKFIYIYQKNAGQAVALNKGLKIFKGEYLTWPDADDILYKDSIEKKVGFLKEKQNYDLVRTAVNIVDFKTGKKIGEFKLSHAKEDIFEDLIFGKDVFYAPVSYMIRAEKFLEVNPTRKIFETRFGQNWQVLLPVSYNAKCGYIDEKLCEYIVRNDSHSRTKSKSIEEEEDKAKKHIEILENVLKPMGLFEKYKNRIYEKYAKILLRQAFLFDNYKFAEKSMKIIKKYDKPNFKDYLYYYAVKYPIVGSIIKIIKNKNRVDT